MNAPGTLLDVRGVGKAFGGLRALTEVSFGVARGSIKASSANDRTYESASSADKPMASRKLIPPMPAPLSMLIMVL